MRKIEKHNGFSRTFKDEKLSLDIFFPLEAYEGNIPEMDMEQQVKLAISAEEADFTSLFARDIPLNVPAFGDHSNK